MSTAGPIQGRLFDVPQNSARHPIHLKPKDDGYALVVDTPNGARADLLSGASWPSALERFLEEQQRTGLRGAITSVSGAELTDVSLCGSCAYPHLQSETPAAFIELAQDRNERSLFPELMPPPYSVTLGAHGARIDLLPERSRHSYLEAYALMHTAHNATGLPAFVDGAHGRVRAMTAKSVPHPSRQY